MREISFSKTKKDIPQEERDNIEAPINGEIYLAYRPTTNEIALFMASLGKNNAAVSFAGVEDFIAIVFEPEAVDLLMQAVRDNVLDFLELANICKDVIREFAENPTTPSGDSSTSRGRTGTSSTATSRPKASTRATSTRRASAE